MNKNFSKLYIVLIVIFSTILTACQGASNVAQKKLNMVLFDTTDKHELDVNYLVQTDSKKFIKKTTQKEIVEQETTAEEVILDFEFLKDAFLLDVFEDYKGNKRALTLKDGVLQFWLNQTMVCEKEIPLPAELSIGNGFYEIIGNPYISEDGSLVLIQSYTTPDGNQKLDYTILTENCNKIITSLANDGYVFQDYEGKYGLAFYRDNPPHPWYPYAGIGFNTVDSNNFILPEPTIIWLNESTVKSVSFGSWGSTSYHYQDIRAISARLDVESYGELDIAFVLEPFEPVEIDDTFLKLLREKFAPREYEERLAQLIQTIMMYKQNN